ncbi:MAG: bifunctional DNA primase/polymerase, partial [Polyangiaceae bacterium]
MSLKHALAYASLGWPVFPVYEPRADGTCTCLRGADCKRPGKHPRNLHGHRAASNDPERLRHWWSLWPDANIGLDTSAVLVVDVDGDAGARSLAALVRQHGPPPRTVEAATGRGRHLY